jgi:hypothetical protein
MSKLMTFHRILPGCEDGDLDAWKAFLGSYTPTALKLFAVYTPWAPEEQWSYWRDALQALSASRSSVLRSFSHHSEREFLVELRAFLLDQVESRLGPSHDSADPPAPSMESLGVLLDGLPVIHQEVIFLTLAGYSLYTIEIMLRITPSVAQEGLERLRDAYASTLERHEDRCLWPVAWIGISKVARVAETTDCTPLRQLIRILDGQASWYDKAPAEVHRARCRHCLEGWTALLEVVAWDRARPALPAEKLEPLLAVIPVKQEKRKTSFLYRMIGR